MRLIDRARQSTLSDHSCADTARVRQLIGLDAQSLKHRACSIESVSTTDEHNMHSLDALLRGYQRLMDAIIWPKSPSKKQPSAPTLPNASASASLPNLLASTSSRTRSKSKRVGSTQLFGGLKLNFLFKSLRGHVDEPAHSEHVAARA